MTHKTNTMKHATTNEAGTEITGLFACPQTFATILVPDEVACGWVKSGEEWIASPAALGYAESYQVRAWMIRGGLDPAAVPAIITAVVPESVPGGINRAEALMRWEYATRVPRDFPLVDVIGSQMNLTPAQIDAAWPEIQTL